MKEQTMTEKPDPAVLAADVLDKLEAATPTPWNLDGPFWVDPPGVKPSEMTVETRQGITGPDRVLVMAGAWESRDADTTAIVAAVNAAPVLARAVLDRDAEIERLRAEIRSLAETTERSGGRADPLWAMLADPDPADPTQPAEPIYDIGPGAFITFDQRTQPAEREGGACDIPGCDQPAVALLANDAPVTSSGYTERNVCRWHRRNPFDAAEADGQGREGER